MRRSISSILTLAAFLLLASAVSIGRGGPIKPSSAGASVRYQSGQALQYAYAAGLSLARGSSQPQNERVEKAARFSVKCDVKITPVWQKDGDTLLKLEVIAATAAVSAREAVGDESPLKVLSANPTFFHWHQRGEVMRVFAAAGDSPISVNFKKGIISLVQLQTIDGERTEVDASGECQAKYTAEAVNKVRKSKHQCSSVRGRTTENDSPLGTQLDLVSETVYELDDERLTSAQSSEAYSLAPNFDSGSLITAKSRQSLKLTGQSNVKKPSGGGSASIAAAPDASAAMKLVSKALRLDFVETSLTLNSETLKCTKHCSPGFLSEQMNSFLKAMKNDKRATPDSAKAFLTLLPLVRQATKDELLSALQSSADAELQLIDVVAFAQTEASSRALTSYIDFASSYDQVKAERYLSAVSLSQHPHLSTVQSLLALYDKSALSPKLHESVGLSLGASACALSRSTDELAQQVIGNVEKTLLSSLSKCSDDPCRASVLGAVRNSRLPGLTDAVIRAVESSVDLAVAYEAVRAAGAIAARRMTGGATTAELDAVKRICKTMNQVFHKTKRTYDGTVRAAAMEVIVNTCQPSTQDFVNIILSTLNQTDFETSAFVQSRLLDMAKSDIRVREHLDLLSQRQMVWNFNTRATGGKSSAFVNQLGGTGGATVGYGLRMHNALNGIMKRTTFELLLSPTGSGAGLPLIATDLYAHGLESLIGTNNADGKSESESSATESSGGMVLALAGVGLHPIEFFGRSSGLMSAVWNAPSTPVSALTINALVLDFNQEIRLQSGFVLEATMSGVASLDLSGAITISLWNRDAHSDVFTQSSIMTNGGINLKNNQLLSLGVSFDNEMTTKLNLVTDVNFYKRPIKMCLQLAVDPYVVRRRWAFYENHRGRGKRQTTTLLRSTKHSGMSYPLGSEIFAQCRALQAS